MIRGIALAILPLIVLGWNVASRAEGQRFVDLSGDWMRAWDDAAIASGRLVHGDFPVAPYLATNSFSRKGQSAYDAFKEAFGGLERASGASLSRPWTGFEGDELFWRRPRVAQRFDDLGRAYVLGVAFEARGLVMPGLLFWIAPAFVAGVLIWLSIESTRAGWPVFGFVMSLLVAVSAFCRDTMMLGYSAVGFYLLGLLAALAFLIGVCRPALGDRGLLLRAFIAGAFLAIATAGRVTSAVVLPVLCATSIWVAVRRRRPGLKAALVALVSALLLIAPTFLFRFHMRSLAAEASGRWGGVPPPSYHAFWMAQWQGLGDFDRTHGHVFTDQAGMKAVSERGGSDMLSERSEGIMKTRFLDSIRSEPSWYALILAQRVVATVSFRKLWPQATPERPGFTPSGSENEGVMDAYWGLTEGADTFSLGSRRLEIPAVLLPVSLLVFLIASAYARKSEGAEWHAIPFVYTACVLPAPVLSTIAGSFEPQAFVLVVFSALAALAQQAVHSWRARRSGQA